MFKSTLFIAVKCCQCATMQVKQRKKSSNKWNCVVCNQKQSVTKIYAQGYQAKEIRNVVQSFNMSRKFEDDQLQQDEVPSLGHFVEQVEGVDEVWGNDKGKRRTDWSEYIDDDNNVEPAYLKSQLNEKEMEDEAEVVTEFPEDLMFKKPRLKGNFGSGKGESYKPDFPKRGISTRGVKETQAGSLNDASMWHECAVRRRYSQQQQQPNKVLTPMKTGASKWSQCTAEDDIPADIGRNSMRQQKQPPNKGMAMMKASVSKWSKYMTGDTDSTDGGDIEVRAPAFADDFRQLCGYKQENDAVDQLIEEEIHPDFM